jgi:two-component system aerobic respiration control protein ArcA
VIMDINLPGKNGLILAREVRDRKNVGLIFLTGRDNDVDRILGLEIGADDYLTKPFNPRELTIRARNLLTRTSNSNDDEDLPSRVSFNGWTLDGDSRSLISPNTTEFRLPRSEFRALHLFLNNPGKILTREQLIMEMTGRELRPNDRTVDVTIRRIRKHFESDPGDIELIVTIHGEGYRFCGSVDA